RPPRVLALVARVHQVVASDAEMVCLLAATSAGEDLLVHARWCEVLGREALSRRFYRVLEQRVHALADSLRVGTDADRRELALLCVSRLLFLSFLEAKGWLDSDPAFLSRHFDACMATGGQFHRRVLLPLFFGTLNTAIRNRSRVARAFGAVPFLNGGLFARSPLERRYRDARFPDEALGALVERLLSAHRFTAQEKQDAWSDAAIDPEMLGRAFESLMAAERRRTQGAYFTPQSLVAHLTDRALVEALAGGALSASDVRRALDADSAPPDASGRALLRTRLREFTVLDPACGSGAFLVFVLERLSALHRAAGDRREMAAIRRDVLARAIHGVDVDPTAVWLCELRLWLAVVIESGERDMSAVPPLPNLDCNVRVGDALSGDAFVERARLVGPPAVLARLRARYVRAVGAGKAPLRRALAREERIRALATLDRQIEALAHLRRERLHARRAADLFGERRRAGAEDQEAMRASRLQSAALRKERRRIAAGGALPFSFPSHFGAAHARGGFSLVIGNPPWVRVHNIAVALRAALKARYAVYRDPGWSAGEGDARAPRGFSAQVDLASLFVERSVHLSAPTGHVALLLPAKLWRSLSGGGVRRLIHEHARLCVVEDWSEAPASFDAAVYPSLVIASGPRAPSHGIDVAVRRGALDVGWRVSDGDLCLVPDDAASPWLLMPPDVRAAFDLLVSHGQPLRASGFGRAVLGVKCGCNEAFLLDVVETGATVTTVTEGGRHGLIERELVRPLLRGDSVAAWRIPPSSRAILWTHARSGGALRHLPSGAARWLAPWRRQLAQRSDLRGSQAWWSLFRTEAADPSRTRVVWSDFGRTPRAAVLAPGDDTVPLNSCYVMPCDDQMDALALTALLNSPVAAAILNALAGIERRLWMTSPPPSGHSAFQSFDKGGCSTPGACAFPQKEPPARPLRRVAPLPSAASSGPRPYVDSVDAAARGSRADSQAR
ncbi:MAG: DNA methyltransferase, partial [bacterium]